MAGLLLSLLAILCCATAQHVHFEGLAFSAHFQFFSQANQYITGILNYDYNASRMVFTYSKFDLVEYYQFNSNQGLDNFDYQYLYTSGAGCGTCHMEALKEPMPVLWRDVDLYGDAPLVRFGNRDAWQLKPPPLFQGPEYDFPIANIWISAVTQTLLKIELTTGGYYLFLNETNTTSFPSVPADCTCANMVDAVFLVDQSSGVTAQDATRSLDFLRSYVSKVMVTPTDLNLALAVYHENTTVVSPFYTNIDPFLASLNSNTITTGAGKRGVASAILGANALVGRPSATKVIILLWNGVTTANLATQAGQTGTLKQIGDDLSAVVTQLKEGTSVVVVGYNWNSTQLEEMVNNSILNKVESSFVNLDSERDVIHLGTEVAAVTCSFFEQPCVGCCDLCGCSACLLPMDPPPPTNSSCPVFSLDLCSERTCNEPNFGCYVKEKCPRNGCTTYTCNPNTGVCSANISQCQGNCKSDKDCNFCAGETCTSTGCSPAGTNPQPCDDKDSCTTDTCVENTCTHVPRTCDIPNTEANKCKIFICEFGQCMPHPDPKCSTSTDPGCLYYWTNWTDCTGLCPSAGTQTRTQYRDGPTCPSNNTSVSQTRPCSLNCTEPPATVSLNPFEVCWENLPNNLWTAYLAYDNNGDIVNIPIGVKNEILVDGKPTSVAAQPIIFIRGISPAFVPVSLSTVTSSTKIQWILGAETLSFTAGELETCPDYALLVYTIIIPQKAPVASDIIAAEKLIAENFALLVQNSENLKITVRMGPENTTEVTNTTSAWNVLVTLRGASPMYHANQFVEAVRYTGTTNLSSTLIGVGAKVAPPNGELHQAVVKFGIRVPIFPPDYSLTGWEIALIVLGSIAGAALLIALVVLATRPPAPGDNHQYEKV